MDGHLADVVRAADQSQCDTVLFAPWTIERTEPHPDELFPSDTKHRVVILGVPERPNGPEWIQIWERGHARPVGFRQYFAKSADSVHLKRDFSAHVRQRILGKTALVICGEINILRTRRGERAISDEFEACAALWESGARVFVNPVHTYMRRYELNRKRAAFSEGRRWTVSVWNRGYQSRESRQPWTAYYSGEEAVDRIVEVTLPGPTMPGVRIGVLGVD